MIYEVLINGNIGAAKNMVDAPGPQTALEKAINAYCDGGGDLPSIDRVEVYKTELGLIR